MTVQQEDKDMVISALADLIGLAPVVREAIIEVAAEPSVIARVEAALATMPLAHVIVSEAEAA